MQSQYDDGYVSLAGAIVQEVLKDYARYYRRALQDFAQPRGEKREVQGIEEFLAFHDRLCEPEHYRYLDALALGELEILLEKTRRTQGEKGTRLGYRSLESAIPRHEKGGGQWKRQRRT